MRIGILTKTDTLWTPLTEGLAMKQNLQNGTSVPEQTMLKTFGTDDCAKRRLLHINPVQFANHFNREPFSLKHNLSDEQLLTLANITELTRSLQIHPGELYADINVLRVDQRWNESPRTNVSPANLVEEINKANAWIIIRHAEIDPKYRTLLERGMVEIKQANGGYWQQPIRKENAIIFVTSPRRISTYHIDRECNFILQIQGEKWIFVFDQNDREVLTEEELERFWALDNNAAVYKTTVSGPLSNVSISVPVTGSMCQSTRLIVGCRTVTKFR